MRKFCAVSAIGVFLLTMGSDGYAGPLADATSDSLWGIQLGGYLDVSYTYDFNDSNDPNNGVSGHSFGNDDNQIQLDAFQLYIDKLPQDAGEVGFRFDILAGEDAQWFEDLFGGYDNNDIAIYQAFISYIAPIGNGLTIDLGRFATGSGYESIESPRNSHFSRDFLFYLMQPWTTTGVRLTYPISEQWEIGGGLFQGVDVVEDNNEAWTFHGAIRWMPTESVYIQDAVYYGAENMRIGWTDANGDGAIASDELDEDVESNDDYTFVNDISVNWDINESWTLGADFNYMNNENAIPTTISTKDADLWGLAGYVRYNVNESLYLALRGEYIEDCDNFTYFYGNVDADRMSVWEVTATLGYTITEGLLTRLEYRHDDSDQDLFLEKDHRDNQQDTISVEVIYSF